MLSENELEEIWNRLFCDQTKYRKVIRAKWLETDWYNKFFKPIWQCSNCMEEYAFDKMEKHNFCPSCGAEMEN